MEKFSEIVKQIDVKSRQLALKFHLLQKENQQNIDKITNYEKKIEELNQQIENLETKIQVITIAKSIPTSKDNILVKRKINELLRELDNCIDLLNNKTI